MKQVYNWKRFWCPREGNINLMDGGYLYDPDSEYGHIYNPDVVPFSAMARTPCLALLGEPGTGKSFAMESERSAIEAQVEASGGRILWLDLRSFGSEDRLVQELFRSDTFISWLSGDHQLHIFLDSLDECLLRINWLGSLLVDELSKYRIERLRFRIACRTADWPNVLENGLRKLWPDEAFKAFELSPLRRVDVGSAAVANELDRERFLGDIDRKGVVPLAIKPVTLRFLLNTYKKKGSFPETQKELYLDGCRLLCEEVNESRVGSGVTGNLSTDLRLAIAARVAAVTVFANRFAVHTGINYGDIAEEDVAIRDLIGGFEIAGEAEVVVTTSHIEEVLSAGLFSSRGFQRIGWAHQTYAEFLAARYVVEHQLSIKQIKDLIVHPGVGDERLVPQLHECAAWIAGMLPAVFRMISRVDPQILLRSDVATTDAEDRAALVESLLTQYDEEKLLDLGWGKRPYDKLKYPGIADRLRPYIIGPSRGMQTRHVAIDIAEACECSELQDDLLCIVLNQAEPLVIRVDAAYAINRIGDRESKARLRPLAYGEAGDDPDDELKGCGLRALWPDHISVEELFGLLTHPKNPSLLGSYKVFLSSDLVSHIEPSDLPTALRWAEQFQDFDDWRSFEELKKAILTKTWENLDEPCVMEPFARLVLSHLKGHHREVDLELTDTDKRRRLVEALLPLVEGAESPWYLLIHSTPRLLNSSDLFWLIDRLLFTQSNEQQPVLAKLIERTIDFSNSSHTDAVGLAAGKNAILAEKLAWLLTPVELGSPQAEEMKRQYAEQQKWQSRMPTRPLLDPPPQTRIERMLEQFEAGDVSRWWRLNMEMTLEPDSQYYGNELCSDLTALPGWNDASDLTRSRIVESAKEYLTKAQPEVERWLGTNTIYRPAFAGYRAIRLLLQRDEEYLARLEPHVWETWASIIVAYPTDSEGEAREKQNELIRRAYQQAPDAVIESLLAIIDKEPSVLRKMEKCVDARLSAALLAKLGNSDLSPDTIGSVLGVLLKNGIPEARSIAESLVREVALNDDKGRAKGKVAARLLLTETEDAGWSVVWPLLNEDFALAEDLISSIAHWGNHGSSPLFPKLNADQLAELYIWLVRRYPPAEDPQHKGAYSVGRRDSIAYWRNAVLDALKRRGTVEACIAIERISEQLPQIAWLKLVLLEAQQIARRETWKPPSPADVIKIASYSKLILSLHGIRTRGAWQKDLNSEIQDAGLKHFPLDYGFFGVMKLLIPSLRRRQVEWFRDEYTKIRAKYPSDTCSVIAHSFGTYLVASALERYREITFDRIIFSGSIVRQDFDWSTAISSGQVNGLLNECAKRDIWVKLGSWLISDAGPSGARGFSDIASGAVRQRHHQLFTHSDYLYSLNYHDNWIPFLKRGEPHELEPSTPRRFNVKFAAFMTGTLILLVLLAWLLLRRL